MTECILFDCDGTLVDSEYLSSHALVLKFQELGVELDPHELLIQYRGWKLAAVLDEICSRYGLKLDADFVETYRKIVSGLFEKELKPITGIHSALDQLPIPRAVVSSGPVSKIKQALRITGLDGYFGADIYSSYDVGIWKPDPGIYEYAAQRMGFPSHQCSVVEDGPVGIEAGVKAGMKVFFFNRFDESLEIEGITSFTSMSELPGLIYQ